MYVEPAWVGNTARPQDGPTAHDIHGIDESVELSSIVDGARTLARFIVDWYGDPR